MSTSTSYAYFDELIPRTSLPHVWVGFMFAGAFLTGEFISVFLEDETALDPALVLIIVAASFYWLYCIHRIHRVLAELTDYRYPVEPGRAAARHIFPIYNIFWLIYWPVKLSSYLNARGRVTILSGYLIGGMLLLAVLLRFVDGAVGTAVLFGVTMYISNKVAKHVEAVKGVDPNQFPPLPDPEIFSRPIETSSPTEEPVQPPRGRIIT
jgi:hypothetical protein